MSTQQYDVVIKDGLIFDGTGAPRVGETWRSPEAELRR